MKLYNLDLSPFAARCRILVYAKGLDLEMLDPPGGLGSAAYAAISPTGKVPALDDEGWILSESDTICEYLEDRFPEPPLRPSDAKARARMRQISRFTDLYIVPPLQALFRQILDPGSADPAAARAHLEELRPRLDQLDGLLEPGPYALGDRLSIADCTLVPLFFFASRVLPLLGAKDPLAERPRLAAWWEAVQPHDAVARVSGELTRAVAARFGGGGR